MFCVGLLDPHNSGFRPFKSVDFNIEVGNPFLEKAGAEAVFQKRGRALPVFFLDALQHLQLLGGIPAGSAQDDSGFPRL